MSKNKTEDFIPNKMRVDQMKILDVYKEAVQYDPSVKRFLVEVATKLNKVLHELDTKENEDVN